MEFLAQTIHMPAAEVLYGVTGLAAHAVGLADRLGTLEPGMLADIVIVDGNPLTDMTAMRHVHTVIKDGQVLVRHGALLWPATEPLHYITR
jgi:imidazolonepropionase-like amidohydrolase